MSFDINSGYSGYSMSNRARDAYENGQMPLSKWTKEKILSNYPEELRKELNKYNLPTLKTNLLRRTSWHHTGSHFQETDFYSTIDPEDVNIESFEVVKQTKQAVEEDKLYYHGSYEEIEYHPYSRKWFNKCSSYKVNFINARKKGNWLVFANGTKKRFDKCNIEKTTKSKRKGI